MQQVLLEGPKSIKTSEASIPSPSAGEVLVEIKATAICGTDVHISAGGVPVDYPRVPGHEAAGVIQETGSEVSAFQTGDAVVINPNLYCNHCERCITGKENICGQTLLMGRETDGVLRQFLSVPQTHLFKLPSHISFAEGALLQPLSTVVHAQRLAAIRPSDSVAVLGQGASGLLHTRLSKLSGAFPVIGIGRSQWKLDLAKRMEADYVVSAATEDPVARVRELTGDQGADVVIEAVGTPETFQQALEMTKPGGRLISFGISTQPLPSLNLLQMYLKEANLIFPRAMTRSDFRRTADLVASKRVDLKSLITQEYALEDAAHAFKFAEEEQSKVLRVVLKP